MIACTSSALRLFILIIHHLTTYKIHRTRARGGTQSQAHVTTTSDLNEIHDLGPSRCVHGALRNTTTKRGSRATPSSADWIDSVGQMRYGTESCYHITHMTYLTWSWSVTMYWTVQVLTSQGHVMKLTECSAKPSDEGVEVGDNLGGCWG